MQLASEEILANAASEFARFRERLGGYRTDMLDHPLAGWCLRNYLILTEFPELLASCVLSEEELYWSRYYWLARFARVWSAIAGYDAGLEQQVDSFLEHSPAGLDHWPAIEAAAEQDAKKQLCAAGME